MRTQSDNDDEEEEVKWGIEKKKTYIFTRVCLIKRTFSLVFSTNYVYRCRGIHESKMCVLFFFLHSFSESKRQRAWERKKIFCCCCCYFFFIPFSVGFLFSIRKLGNESVRRRFILCHTFVLIHKIQSQLSIDIFADFFFIPLMKMLIKYNSSLYKFQKKKIDSCISFFFLSL